MVALPVCNLLENHMRLYQLPVVVAGVLAEAVLAMPQCDADQTPLVPAAVRYPNYEEVRHLLPGTSYLHVHVRGYVTVEFVIREDGTVDDLEVAASEAHAVARRKELGLDGFFDQTALEVGATLRFPSRDAPCRARYRFEWEPKR